MSIAPEDLRITYTTTAADLSALHGLFDEYVAEHPNDTALVTKDRRWTFQEFKAESDALAAGLLGAGVKAQDIVSVQLPNWPEFCFLQIALSRIGAVIQPAHLVFRERELRSRRPRVPSTV